MLQGQAEAQRGSQKCGIWKVEFLKALRHYGNKALRRNFSYCPIALSPYCLKRAFTLAEVLITLAIIGIVAAMTIPTLIQKQNEKATVTHLKKVYSILSQSYQRIIDDEGGTLNPDNFDELKLMESFGKYIKYMKVCGYERGCFPNVNYKRIAGTNYFNYEDTDNRTRAVLSDGTAIMFNVSDMSNNPIYAQIYLDINGYKGPNILGRDFFHFYLSPTNIYPGGDPRLDALLGHTPGYDFDNSCKPNDSWACAAWVIYNENMDYLKCPNDLSWNGKHKCD